MELATRLPQDHQQQQSMTSWPSYTVSTSRYVLDNVDEDKTIAERRAPGCSESVMRSAGDRALMSSTLGVQIDVVCW